EHACERSTRLPHCEVERRALPCPAPVVPRRRVLERPLEEIEALERRRKRLEGPFAFDLRLRYPVVQLRLVGHVLAEPFRAAPAQVDDGRCTRPFAGHCELEALELDLLDLQSET